MLIKIELLVGEYIMWPLPRFSHKQLHTIIQPTGIDCYYMAKDNNLIATVVAHKHYEVNLAADNLIYNITALTVPLTDFVNIHNLHAAYHYITVMRPFIDEKIIMHNTNHATLHELLEPKMHTHYTYHYLDTDKNYFLFYLSSIAQPLLLQLKLIHARLDLHLQAIFTPFELHMKLHHYLQPQQQLASLIDNATVTIKQLETREFVQQYMQHHHEHTNTEQLLYALGSFIGAQE